MSNKAVKLAELAVSVAEPILKSRGHIRVISHYDADGICSAAIIYKILEELGRDFEINFVKQLERGVVKDIAKKDADLFIFTDLGSGQLDVIKEFIKDRPVVVADHHAPLDVSWDKLYQLNPHLVGIDGKDEISGAGVTYILSRVLTKKARELMNLAIIGAVGDMQTVKGRFISINKMMLSDAEIQGTLKVEKGLRIYGRYTRPLHKALEYLSDPYIDGISGKESGAIQFLTELGIPVKNKKDKWRTLSDLTGAEEKKLATALVLEAVSSGIEKPDLVGDLYILPNKYEVREFTTILNACGKLEHPVEGLDLCLGTGSEPEEIIARYKKQLSRYMAWVRVNKEKFRHSDNVTYLVADDKISDNFIGTVVSVAMKSTFNSRVVFGFARSSNGVKISGRVNRKWEGTIDIGGIIKEAAESVGGEGGGHKVAAGGKIPFGSEERFIKVVDKKLTEALS